MDTKGVWLHDSYCTWDIVVLKLVGSLNGVCLIDLSSETVCWSLANKMVGLTPIEATAIFLLILTLCIHKRLAKVGVS